MPRKPLQFLLATVCCTPLSALALGVGQIQVRSNLNQVLNAEVPLGLRNAAEAANLTARLPASPVFARYGVERSSVLSDLQFSVEAGSGGGVLRISSKKPIREPMLNFLVEFDWPQGRLIREFAVLLDPPTTARRSGTPPLPARVTAPGRMVTFETGSPALTDSGRAAAPPPVEVKHRGEATYGPIPVGDTASAIAARVRPDPSIGNRQMMQALLAANPRAFCRGSVSCLKAGATLRIPSAQEIDPQRFTEAASRQLASKQQIPAPPPATPRIAQATPAPAEGPKVRLVPPQQESPRPPGREATPSPGPPVAAVEKPFQIPLEDNHPKLRVAGLDEVRGRIGGPAAPLAGQPPGPAAVPESSPVAPELARSPAPSLPASPVAEPPTPPRATGTEPSFQTVGGPGDKGPAAPVPSGPGVPPVEAPIRPVDSTRPPAIAETPPPAPARPAPPPAAPSVPATTPPPVPKPAPAAARTPPEPSLMDFIIGRLQDPLLLVLLGFLLLLIVAVPVLLLRRRARAHDGRDGLDSELAIVTGGESPEETVVLTQHNRTHGITSTRPKSVRLTSNPLERADLLIAVANYEEAENVLRKALGETPEDPELTMKLLDLHYATANKAAFLREARLFHEKVSENDPHWARTVVMGRKLCPEADLFSITSAVTATITMPNKPGAEAGLLKPGGIPLTPSPPAGGAGPGGRPPLDKAAPPAAKPASIDLGALDWRSSLPETPTVKTTPAVAAPTGAANQPAAGIKAAGPGGGPQPSPTSRPDPDSMKAILDELDYQFPAGEPPNITITAISDDNEESDAAAAAFKELGLDFKLDAGKAGGGPAEENSIFSTGLDDGLSQLGLTNLPATEPPKSWDERSLPSISLDFPSTRRVDRDGGEGEVSAEDYVETKLDLAIAYLEMGDKVGARSLLEEVLAEGNPAQKERAQNYIGKVDSA